MVKAERAGFSAARAVDFVCRFEVTARPGSAPLAGAFISGGPLRFEPGLEVADTVADVAAAQRQVWRSRTRAAPLA